jgi:putative DNA primase/helicase
MVQDREEARARVNESVERFVRENADGADGQVQRVARRFGLLAAAGELATDWDILPYWPNDAWRAVQRCFLAWLVARGTTGPSEIERGIAKVRAFFEQHGVSRFEPMDDEQGRVTYNRAGLRDGNMRYVFPEAWVEICEGYDAKMLTGELVKRGVLAVDAEGKPQKAKRLPGFETAIRVYHVDLDRLFEGVEQPSEDEIDF